MPNETYDKFVIAVEAVMDFLSSFFSNKKNDKK